MTSARAKIERRKKALKQVDELSKKGSHVLMVNYSCESFYDRKDGRTPRITSIAVRNFSSGQTQSFSIHKLAELSGCPPEDIETRYDELERNTLEEFFKYLEAHLEYDWVHWNMRDINYGFHALEHRFKVLKGGQVARLDESRKHDLSRLIIDAYGPKYIGHPRLKTLMERNNIKPKDFLDGRAEAKAFEDKEFVRLHQSTLRKADILANIFGRFNDGTLKTDADWRDRYGIHPAILIEFAVKHWIYSLLCLALSLVGAWSVINPLFMRDSSTPSDAAEAPRASTLMLNR